MRLQRICNRRRCAWCLALLFAHGAPGAELGAPALIIAVSPQAGVDATVLADALLLAERILTDAGLGVDIDLCESKGAKRPACSTDLTAARIWIRLKRDSRGDRDFRRGAPFGRAYLDGEGKPGRLADVFPERVRDHARRTDVRESVLLGHVLAHEVGHLLLGRSPHPIAGLMSGKWGRRQLEQAGQGRLTFLDEEAGAMRAQLAMRLETAEPPTHFAAHIPN